MTYCAPCLADLALVREAVTSVSGTAACVAHAVLLTHPGDTPQRRLERLSDLRSMAEAKLPTASAEDAPAIELLVQEYALAGAMDMTVPLKDLAGERAPRPDKKRRNRGRDRDRGPRPAGEGAASAPADTSAPETGGRNEQAAPEQEQAAHEPAAIATSPDLSEPDPAPAAPAPAAEQGTEQSAPVAE